MKTYNPFKALKTGQKYVLFEGLGYKFALPKEQAKEFLNYDFQYYYTSNKDFEFMGNHIRGEINFLPVFEKIGKGVKINNGYFKGYYEIVEFKGIEKTKYYPILKLSGTDNWAYDIISKAKEKDLILADDFVISTHYLIFENEEKLKEFQKVLPEIKNEIEEKEREEAFEELENYEIPDYIEILDAGFSRYNKRNLLVKFRAEKFGIEDWIEPFEFDYFPYEEFEIPEKINGYKLEEKSLGYNGLCLTYKKGNDFVNFYMRREECSTEKLIELFNENKNDEF